ncbi:MAG: protein kinase [Planctomyces sp.]|nr:protein kinase [Planctomyces sp.]
MATTGKLLLRRLVDCGLWTADEASALESALASDADGETTARDLIRQGRLTKFQARRLLASKPGILVLGNYILLDEIGAGGMGQVFKAEHRRMKRIVALKVLPQNVTRDPDAVQRFHREVQAAARLSHPNVVAAHDADEAKGVHYLVMEYVEGEDLASLVKRTGPRPLNDAVNLILQAARGLDYAHAQGIVHRDIKPSNLLVDRRGTLKILDMGLARIDGPGMDGGTLTSTGMVMGTVDYMSPEQALDAKHAGAESDVYSLGCTLFYLATGRPPYAGETVMKKLLAHREDPIPALQEHVPGPVADLDSNADEAARAAMVDSVLRRMLAKSPGERLTSMRAVIEALEATSVAATSAAGAVGVSPPQKLASRPTGDIVHAAPQPAARRVQSEEDTSPSSAGGETLTDLAADLKRAIAAQALNAGRPQRKPNHSGPNAGAPRSPRFGSRRAALFACGLIAGLGLLAGLLLRVKTPAGTIVIRAVQAELVGAEVLVDGEKRITIRAEGDSEPIVVAADAREHTLHVLKGGFETYTRRFTVNAGAATPIEVWLEPLAEDEPASGEQGAKNAGPPAGGNAAIVAQPIASPPETERGDEGATEILEAEAVWDLTPPGGIVEVQEMKGWPLDAWSGDQQLIWMDGRPGDRIELPFEVVRSGPAQIDVKFTRAEDYQIVDVDVDGKKLAGPIDLYTPVGVMRLGARLRSQPHLDAGPHVLGITVAGGNPAAKHARIVGIDFIRVTTPEGEPLLRRHREAPESLAIAPMIQVPSWNLKFYSWTPAGEREPPQDWEQVVSGTPLAEREATRLNLGLIVWGAPESNVPPDYFAVVATGEFEADGSDCILEAIHDDGIRVYIDEELVYDDWRWHPHGRERVRLRPAAGNRRIRVEYFEIDGGASLCVRLFRAPQDIVRPLPFGEAASGFDLLYVRPDQSLLAFNVGTGESQVITGGPVRAASADWVLGGREIAMPQGRDVIVFDPLAPQNRRVLASFETPLKHLAVTPDASWACGEGFDFPPALRLLNMASGGAYDLGSAADPAWSDDGKTLIYIVWRGRWDVALLDVDRIDIEARADGAPPAVSPHWTAAFPVSRAGFVYPTMSPDGAVLALGMEGEGDTCQIGLMTIADQSVRRLTEGPLNCLFPSFSPDGRFLAYLRTADLFAANGRYELVVSDLIDQTEKVVATNATKARPVWRAAGSLTAAGK